MQQPLRRPQETVMKVIGIENETSEEIVRLALHNRHWGRHYNATNAAVQRTGFGSDIRGHDCHELAGCYEAEAARRGLKIEPRLVEPTRMTLDEVSGAMYPDEYRGLSCFKCFGGYDDKASARYVEPVKAALKPFGVPTWLAPLPEKRADTLRQLVASWYRDQRGHGGSVEALAVVVQEIAPTV